MDIKSVFHKIISGIKIAGEKVGQVLGILEKQAPVIEQYAQAAITIIESINAIAPNRAFTELEALASKFNLHLTPEIASNPIEVETLLQNSALVELQKVAPSVPNSLLRSAIALAFNTFKASQTS